MTVADEPQQVDAANNPVPVQPLVYKPTATLEQRVARLERHLLLFQWMATLMAGMVIVLVWLVCKYMRII
jgi:hypothetical protein